MSARVTSKPTDRPAHEPGAWRCALGWSARLSALLLVACTARAPISLTPEWPRATGPYLEVHRAWTRHGLLRKGYQEVIEVYATFKSPAWRAAYIERQATVAHLSPDERALLVQSQQNAAAEGPYEVQLLVTTHDFRENDLNRGERSIWRVVLRDDRGNQVPAESIVRDRRPLQVIRAEFPDMGDFAVAYIARFPRTIEVLRADAEAFTLELSSPRGAVTLTWQNSRNQ